MTRQKYPYEDSKLTPEQSRNGIDKMLKDMMHCKDFGWIVRDSQYTLHFALPIKSEGTERMIGYMYAPPLIPREVRQYSVNLRHYEKVMVNDEVAAFRVLFWYLKNKFIAIRTGLVSAEEELMAHIALKLPNGRDGTLIEKFRLELPKLANPDQFALTSQPQPPGSTEKRDDTKTVEADYRPTG